MVLGMKTCPSFALDDLFAAAAKSDLNARDIASVFRPWKIRDATPDTEKARVFEAALSADRVFAYFRLALD